MAGIDLKSSDDGLKLFRAADLDGATHAAQFRRNSARNSAQSSDARLPIQATAASPSLSSKSWRTSSRHC